MSSDCTCLSLNRSSSWFAGQDASKINIPLYNRNAMEHIGANLPEFKQEKSRKTERGELMVYFRAKLNASREEDGLKPLSMGRIGMLLQGIPTKDLYYLKSICKQAKHFSKKFWWEINPKNHEGKQFGQE